MQGSSVLVIAADEDRPSVQPLLAALTSKGAAVVVRDDGADEAVLVATPHAAASPLVDRSLARFAADHPAANILVVLLDGELQWDDEADRFDAVSTTALSPDAQALFTSRPLWLDARGGFTPHLLTRAVASLAPEGEARCPACGERTKPDDVFCPGCGAVLARPEEPSAPAPMPVQSVGPLAAPPPAGARPAGRRWRMPAVIVLVLALALVTATFLAARGGSDGGTAPATTGVGPTTPPTTTAGVGPTTPPLTTAGVGPTTPPPTTTAPASSGGGSWLPPALFLVAGLAAGVGIGLLVAHRRRGTRTSMAPRPVQPTMAAVSAPISSPPSAGTTVFISHNFDTEHALALRLAKDLRPRVAVWVAPESIHAGESWLSSVERGLSASGVFVALLSKAALASPWVLKEIQAAMELEAERRLRLVPVQVEECELPILLRTYQLLRLSSGYGQILQETVRLATAG